MALQTYQVRVRDNAGALVAVFAGAGNDGWQSLTYTRRLNSLGQFALYLTLPDSRAAYLKTIGGQIEVWRRDPPAGTAWLAALPAWRRDAQTAVSGWYKDFEGFIRAWNSGFTTEGRRVLVCQGRQYNDLLAGETINFPADTPQSRKIGLPGAVAVAWVDENIGPLAGVDALGNSRVRTGLTATVESETANIWRGNRSNKLLLDVLQELGEFAPGDFMIVGTGASQLRFIWRGTRWGLDRTPGNPLGTPPCVLSTLNNNVTSVTFGYNALDETNVVYVGGQGTGTGRTYLTAATPAATAGNWLRRAVFRDARDTDNAATLEARAAAELEDGRVKYRASFTVLQTTATRYGRDWDLGDLLRFVDEDGTPRNLQVRGIQVSLNSEGEETINPELRDE
jgi:hypothetical protein